MKNLVENFKFVGISCLIFRMKTYADPKRCFGAALADLKATWGWEAGSHSFAGAGKLSGIQASWPVAPRTSFVENRMEFFFIQTDLD